MGRIVLTLAIMAAAMWALAQPASGVTYAQTERAVALGPVKDNTLYEQPRGILSNGAGQHFFAGKTNSGVIKRGVIAFDITGSMPAGSTVTRVSLRSSCPERRPQTK